MLKYWLWLSNLSGLSVRGQRIALNHFGTPEEAYLSDHVAIEAVEGLSSRERQALEQKDLQRANDILTDCNQKHIHILTIQDAMYPERLKNIDTPPLVLYYCGTLLPFDSLPAITVVGSRKASGYGLTVAKRMGYQLGQCGAVVVSGAARGVDSLALEGALSAGASVAAVLGNGLDIVYPAEARALYRDIAQHGCLMTEYAPGTPPLAQNFPRRNRILSGLSLGVVVVEAPKKSGSLITAELALEQGRDVFAVPGNIGLEASEGTNALIRDGAALVTCGWDVLREYEAQFPDKLHRKNGGSRMTAEPQTAETLKVATPIQIPKSEKKPEKGDNSVEKQEKIPAKMQNSIDNEENRNYIDLQQVQSELTPDERAIVDVLLTGQHHVDDIILKTSLPPARVLASLTLLEVKGYVTQQPGKRFDSNLK